MRTRNLVLGSVVLVPLLAAVPAPAQQIRADLRIGGGPVAGQVIMGNAREGYDSRWNDNRRPRQVRVEIIGRRDRSWIGRFRREARVVVVYYDRRRDSYYYDRFRPGLQEIRVFERNGRYYRDDQRYFDDRGAGGRDWEHN